MAQARVLVVEDDMDNRQLLCFLLKQQNFEVYEAGDGRTGLEKAISCQPDLLLLDMSIPEIDGWKLARQLKDAPETRKICIVAVTGHTMPEDREKALEAGCDGYISKPLDIPTFVERVKEYLDVQRDDIG